MQNRASGIYPMCSEQMLRQLEGMTRDPRFRAMSKLDLQNILTAIELCGLGFSRGVEVAEDLPMNGRKDVLRTQSPKTNSYE